jgi:predicted O-linked N-acetylglucosamine transferase (SPINDLY family)
MADSPSQQQDLIKKADAFLTKGEPGQAEALMRRYLTRNPNDAQANFFLAVALWFQGKVAQCDFFIRKAVALAPNVSKHQNLLGQVCMKTGKPDESVERCRLACELDPRDSTAWNALGAMYMLLERAEEAAEPLRRAYELDKSDMTAVCNYAGCLADNAKTEEACNILAQGLARAPNDLAALITFAGMLNYPHGIANEAKLALVTRLGAILDSFARGQSVHRVTDFTPARPLRVGVISADLRTHSCSFFLGTLFRHLPAQPGFELFVYDSTAHPDTTTSPRLRAMLPPHNWRSVKALTDEALAREVARDDIDIIIETGGHTGSSRVGAMAWKPAPVTVTWLGYPCSTGLRSIDWRIVDSITDPPGSERWHTERLARLDDHGPGPFLCYDPGDTPPDPKWQGLRTARPIVFGSFNATKKVCQKTIDLWSGVLLAVPDSCLLLKGHATPGGIGDRELRAHFQRRGVDPSRIEIMARTKTLDEHLRAYDRLDIALDTFPYNGTTTTCEALFMGVPVVTLSGDLHVSRVSSSLLTAVGAPELIATTDTLFVNNAQDLAQSPHRITDYHATLRARLLASPLCDAPAFAARFAHTLRAMWADACARRTAT